MSATREPQTIIAAWLEEGPMDLPTDTRRAIVVGARTVTQRRRRIPLLRGGSLPTLRDSMLRYGLALGAVVLAAVVGFAAWSGQLNNLLPAGPSPTLPALAGPAPDGQPQPGAIAYTSSGRIVLVDPASSEVRVLTPPLADLVVEWLGTSCGGPQRNRDGTARDLTASEMAWSPDGRALAFVPYSDRSRLGCGVFVVSADGETLGALLDAESHHSTSLGGPSVLGWSPDGTQVAIGRGESIIIASLDGSDPVDLGNPCPGCVVGRFSKVGWSPDGTMVAAQFFVADDDNRGPIAVVETATGTWTTLWPVDGIPSPGEELQFWLPDGSLVIQASWGGVFAVDPTNPQQRRALDIEETPNPWFQVWSPDQTRVAWNTGGAGETMVHDLATGDTTQLVDWSASGQPVWSPDGSQLGLIHETDWSVWLVGADGSNARRVAQGDISGSLAWQPVWR